MSRAVQDEWSVGERGVEGTAWPLPVFLLSIVIGDPSQCGVSLAQLGHVNVPVCKVLRSCVRANATAGCGSKMDEGAPRREWEGVL